MFVILVILGSLPFIIYFYITWNKHYWIKRGVPGPEPTFLFGSFPGVFTQKQHLADDLCDIYQKYNKRNNYIGVFFICQPMLMILDPKMVHDVLVTNFKNFQDNEFSKLINGKKDPLLAKNPFVLVGREWRDQRVLVSPGLSASRVKVAYHIMEGVCETMCEYVENEIKVPPKDGVNTKDLALLFTCENVSDSVLGVKAKSFTNEKIPIGENVYSFVEGNSAFSIFVLLAGLFPTLLKFFNAKFIPKNTEQFFLTLMKKAFQMRIENKVDRQDFMNHLMSMKERKGLSDIELASHSMTFLIDGLDTTATVISHCLLLLSRYPDTQKRLSQEIIQNLNEEGKLTFEKLNELPYLDACFNESIRMFTPGHFSSKICTEPFEFINKNGDKYTAQVGEAILLPLYALHQDPEYFPQPEMFKPERFMPENGGAKKYRDLGAFLPFGDGPRMCMGMRFAITQAKAAISSIVRNFEISVNPKTQLKNQLDPKIFVVVQKGGVWLDFKKRKTATI